MTKKRVGWVDVIRAVAIFFVLASHCGDNVPQALRTTETYLTINTAFNSFLRPCVPLFIMLTGFLLLPLASSEMGAFYKKRISRVALPFLVWVVVFSCWGWLMSLFGGDLQSVEGFFAYAAGDPSQALGDSLMRVVWSFRNFGTYITHMWYIYVIIGLYLYLPIFSAWVKQATERQKWGYLAIWGVTLFIPYIKEFIPSMPYPEANYVWGGCAWNEFHMLYAFAGYNGYLLLGHLLGNMKPWSWAKTLAFAVPAFAAGYAVTLAGFKGMLMTPGATEWQIELFFTYCTPNVVLMTAALWMVLRKIDWHNRWLANLADCSFGIYLIHYVALGPIYRALNTLGLDSVSHLVLSSILVLVASWAIVAAMRCLPISYLLTGAPRLWR